MPAMRADDIHCLTNPEEHCASYGASLDATVQHAAVVSTRKGCWGRRVVNSKATREPCALLGRQDPRLYKNSLRTIARLTMVATVPHPPLKGFEHEHKKLPPKAIRVWRTQGLVPPYSSPPLEHDHMRRVRCDDPLEDRYNPSAWIAGTR